MLLLQHSLFWMKELENFVQWSKLAAVTQIECMDHAEMLGCVGGGLWAACATFQKKDVAVIYLNCKGPFWWRQIPNRSPWLDWNEWAWQTMRAAAVTGQSWGDHIKEERYFLNLLFVLLCGPPNAD